MTLKLGSLFDGSGGFPLAGAINGIEPVWASEIEPYPVRVTTARFPAMKHLGDVTKIDGAAIEPVDIITFGSPCQDLSVAGKQAGLHKGERSNLFFEAIRIIKEMRESTDGIYPRIAVWENVPGAFSSNKGADFQAVLQAFCEVKDPAARVPMPPKNKWGKSGAIVGDGWSVAWRTFDAQYWGVPQRRKRIYLIADFGSERAGEILFEQEGVRGDTAESGTAGKGIARDVKGSVGGSVFNESGKGYWMPGCGCLRAEGENRPSRPGHIVCLNPHESQSQRIYDVSGVYPCLSSNESGGLNRQAVCFQQNQAVCYPAEDAEGSVGRGVVYAIDSLSSNSMKSPNPNSGFHEEEIAKCLDTSGGNPSCNQGGNVIVQQPCYAVRTRNTTANGWGVSKEAYTLDTSEGQAVAYSVDCRNMNLTPEHGTLQAKENGGQSLNYMGAVCYPIEGNGSRPSHQGPGYSDSDKSYTLNTIERHGVCYAAAFKYGNSAEARSIGYQEEISPTLQGGEGGNQKPVVCYPIDSHQQDSRFKVCADGISPTLPGQMGTGGNNGPMVLTYRKTAHPRNADEGQGWEPTDKADTLNTFDNSEGRTPTAVVETYQKVRNDNGDAKKTRCREILLGLWEAYVEKTLQGSVGEQQGLQQTEILRPEVHGRALDKPTENRDKLLGESCDCESGSGCWVLRNMREAECDGCASQGRQLSEQQPGQFDADLQELPQQATQGGGEVQDLRKESQRVGILREALSKVQEIWKPAHDKSQPVQRKYIIRRLTPLEACRLQGFPDWWCDGLVTDEPTDEDMAFWREVFETHRKAIGTSTKPKTDNQIIKWLKQPHTDSAEYKMWGNGIALPNAEYVVRQAKKLLTSQK